MMVSNRSGWFGDAECRKIRLNAVLRDLCINGIKLESNEFSIGRKACYSRSSRPNAVVKNDIVFLGVRADKILKQRQWLLRRMEHWPFALRSFKILNRSRVTFAIFVLNGSYFLGTVYVRRPQSRSLVVGGAFGHLREIARWFFRKNQYVLVRNKRPLF